MRNAMADAAFKDHLMTMGMRPKPLTPEDYRAFLTREAARWKEYVKTAKIEPQ
jgi:tripartite-type tricarboxylate transporter receptor subunit TctC